MSHPLERTIGLITNTGVLIWCVYLMVPDFYNYGRMGASKGVLVEISGAAVGPLYVGAFFSIFCLIGLWGFFKGKTQYIQAGLIGNTMSFIFIATATLIQSGFSPVSWWFYIMLAIITTFAYFDEALNDK